MLNRIISSLFVGFILFSGYLRAQPPSGRASVELGRLATGGSVEFIWTASGQWGFAVSSTSKSRLMQPKPVQIEVFNTEQDIRQMATGYNSVEKDGSGVIARAEAHYGAGVTFHIEDQWSINNAVLSVHRTVYVAGNAPGGFYSGLILSTSPSVTWHSIDYFVPAVLYAGPGPNNQYGPAGENAFRARRFALREDSLPAPILGLVFQDGSTVAMLDPAPRGDTIEEDTRATVATVLIDGRFRYGALGAREAAKGGVDFGYWYPGSITTPKRPTENSGRPPGLNLVRRYHPMKDGFVQDYRLSFRFGQNESFPVFTRDAWRWAWKTLNPPVSSLDVELVRRTLLDHVANHVFTIDGRSGIPWIFQVTNGEVWHRPDDMRAVMGFCGKNIELADELLLEGDRDPSPRGKRMRRLGLAVIESFIRSVPMSPPAGEGFDLTTGKPSLNLPASSWRGNLENGERLYLRPPSEDMRRLMEAYLREKEEGREHSEWLRWCRQYADWLLPQQRPDGSFPRSWRPGTITVVDSSGTSSYNPVPLLVLLSKATRPAGAKYLDAAKLAGEYVWRTEGEKGIFIGGTIDNPDVIDKEAGALSLEAFLSLFEETRDAKWLSRAEAAANFAETWMWIWNVPMAPDADNAVLHWKKGVPTFGLQAVTVRGAGGGDEYLDWSTSSYAKLYKYTNDAHYLDVARILLHDTKAMLALPGRTYDMDGPGWQQENFSLSMRRGFGSHRGWLPWISAGHLWSIDGLEAFDPALYKQLSSNRPAVSSLALPQ